MKAIYVGGQNYKGKGKSHWKIYLSLFLFLAVVGSVLKIAAPTIVENWINKNGTGSASYAFSVRDVDLALSKGQVILNDVKVFHPKTNAELIQSAHLTVHLNWLDLLRSQEKRVTVVADELEVILSKDFTSELDRIEALKQLEHDFYLSSFEAKIGKLNLIEKKDDESRTVLELKEVILKAKDFTPHSINKKTEFNLSSLIAEGGKLNLIGKTAQENGETAWSLQGSLKQAPRDILNKIAGDKLPFSFNEARLNAEIMAHSDHGKVSGLITPEIKRLNLIDEKPGIPTQVIARALTDELTFSLPFTLKDDLTVQYSAQFAKLKNYRKYWGPQTSSFKANAPGPLANGRI